MNEEYLNGFREIYSEYSDEHIRSLLEGGDVSFDPEAWRLLQEEAHRRSIRLSDESGHADVERAGLKERFLALLIDIGILAAIVFGFIMFLPETLIGNSAAVLILLIGGNLLFLSKDSTGQSPGKRIMNIRIVNKSDLATPNMILPFIRNLFLCIGVIEVIVLLSNRSQERLGDKVTGTIVIKDK